MEILKAWIDGYVLGAGLAVHVLKAKDLWNNLLPDYVKKITSENEFQGFWDEFSEQIREKYYSQDN
jgi:hypothetical protein